MCPLTLYNPITSAMWLRDGVSSLENVTVWGDVQWAALVSNAVTNWCETLWSYAAVTNYIQHAGHGSNFRAITVYNKQIFLLYKKT